MLSTHVLDTSTGSPAAGVAIALFALHDTTVERIASAVTNADGRTDAPLARDLAAGIYEIRFAVAAYFANAGVAAFYDTISVRFVVADGARKYHVPLLLSPWGYSTYRGS